MVRSLSDHDPISNIHEAQWLWRHLRAKQKVMVDVQGTGVAPGKSKRHLRLHDTALSRLPLVHECAIFVDKAGGDGVGVSPTTLKNNTGRECVLFP